MAYSEKVIDHYKTRETWARWTRAVPKSGLVWSARRNAAT